jgi:iron complex transport system permease protein
LLVFSIFFGLLTGASGLGIKDLFKIIASGDTESPEAVIFIYVRAPRVIASLVCGAALAVSGAVIQNVLHNRLASPSIIGVNSGAALAVVLASACGAAGGLRISLFAFLGASLTVLAVGLGAKVWGASRGTVILMGVALNSLLGAFSDAVVSFVPELSIYSADFRIGDFSSMTYQKIAFACTMILTALFVLFLLSNVLDVLTLGDDNARGLGVNASRARIVFLLLCAMLAGAAVSIAGMLSFIGLLVPHAVRRISGNRSSRLLPLSAIFGAGFVTLSDGLSKLIFAPYEIPVGIIMAVLGAPFFLFILLKGGRSCD